MDKERDLVTDAYDAHYVFVAALLIVGLVAVMIIARLVGTGA